jgi:hypothetical protein
LDPSMTLTHQQQPLLVINLICLHLTRGP